MKPFTKLTKQSAIWLPLALILAIALAACSSQPQKQSAAPTTAPDVAAGSSTEAPPSSSAQTNSQDNAAQLKLLKVEPVSGFVGTNFTVTGEGLTPGKQVEFVWMTVVGTYDEKVKLDIVEFYEPIFAERKISLGRAAVDAQGHISANFAAPSDYGETHDIYAMVDGQKVAKAGFRIRRNVTIAPTEGPIGTPITIKVTGLGWKPIERNMALRYDNHFTGFVSAVTTNGTALAQIRASGPVGLHTIELSGTGATGGGYLNNQQSPYAHIFPENGSFRVTFNVTKDAGAPQDTLQWPDADRVAQLTDSDATTTGNGDFKSARASLSLEPASGPVLTKTTLHAKNLPANTEFQLSWGTVLGDKVGSPGWAPEPTRNLADIDLGKATSGSDGSITATVEVPDELGGWHTVKLSQNGKMIAQSRFYVLRSLVAVSPKRVKVGETFTLELKGIGWTDIDNGVAATYDNAYFGYACGFNSRGRVVINVPAAGTPGTHLIDLYPMTYLRTGKPLWPYVMPQLTFGQDHPGLGLGYNLPAYRIAIEVIE